MTVTAICDLIDATMIAGNHDHGQPLRRRLLRQNQPIDSAWQVEVHDDDIDVAISRQRGAHLDSIRSQDESIALVGEGPAQKLANVTVVLDDQNLADLLQSGLQRSLVGTASDPTVRVASTVLATRTVGS